MATVSLFASFGATVLATALRGPLGFPDNKDIPVERLGHQIPSVVSKF